MKDKKLIVGIVVVVLVIVGAVCLTRQKPSTQNEPEVITSLPETAPEPIAPAAELAPDASQPASPEAIVQARELVETEFARFGEGFTLQELTYNEVLSTDPEQLDYVNSLERGVFDEVIVFDSLFHTPTAFDEITAWEPDIDYTWTWYVAHEQGGDWQIVTYGY